MKTLLATLQQPAWRNIITQQVPKQKLKQLDEFLQQQIEAGKTIYPEQQHWFRALNELAPEDVRVVILGQDPYHGPGQAQGLSFSVPDGQKCPPSLRNIFKELKNDLAIENQNLDLSAWLKQGVLLLNAVLTVEHKKAGSHSKKGWELITDAVISALSAEQKQIVFLLWGGYAEKKVTLIDASKHAIFTATHPSPLSAHRGWFGSKPFSKTNQYLIAQQRQPIDWRTDSIIQSTLF